MEFTISQRQKTDAGQYVQQGLSSLLHHVSQPVASTGARRGRNDNADSFHYMGVKTL